MDRAAGHSVGFGDVGLKPGAFYEPIALVSLYNCFHKFRV